MIPHAIESRANHLAERAEEARVIAQHHEEMAKRWQTIAEHYEALAEAAERVWDGIVTEGLPPSRPATPQQPA
jgi:hypothetical protein